MIMYENNIYVKNHKEIANYGVDIGQALKTFNSKHNVKYDELAEAQYRHWRSVETNSPELLSARKIALLKQKGFIKE